MVFVQRCVQGIFLDNNRQLLVGGFVLVSGNFRTNTSSFCGSQLTGDTGRRHAGRQAWDQHVAEGAQLLPITSWRAPPDRPGLLPLHQGQLLRPGPQAARGNDRKWADCTARVASGGESHGQNPFSLAQDQGPLGKAVET